MTYLEIKTIEDAGRSSMAWRPEGYDGQTHVAGLVRAVAPALLILTAATVLLLAVL